MHWLDDESFINTPLEVWGVRPDFFWRKNRRRLMAYGEIVRSFTNLPHCQLPIIFCTNIIYLPWKFWTFYRYCISLAAPVPKNNVHLQVYVRFNYIHSIVNWLHHAVWGIPRSLVNVRFCLQFSSALPVRHWRANTGIGAKLKWKLER